MSRNVIVGWASRGLVLLLSLVNTRLLIDNMGAEGVAAYSIIISLTPWLALLNLGLPLTIQNTISHLRGANKDYQTVRNQAYGTMFFIGLAILPLVVVMGWLSHHFLLAKYPFASLESVVAVFLFIYIAGVCQLLTQVMYAEHETFWPNIYPVLAPIWTTCALFCAKYFSFVDFNILILVLALSNVVAPIHAAKRLQIFKRLQFNIRIAKQQIRSSKHQLLFATLSAATLSADYLVMSRTLAALDIVHYNLTSRLFMAVLVIHGVLLATNWTPIADMLHSAKKMRLEKNNATTDARSHDRYFRGLFYLVRNQPYC
ncbi:hypothetical protein [Chromobacterium haemolyticum]|uniref:hypothetical protein n=1 Tax=Chromobacterium haemolyticum TaxID=394935 RepID=UPI0013B4299A|nr:hypothetical protein [Chromobacterium haemolyticum]